MNRNVSAEQFVQDELPGMPVRRPTLPVIQSDNPKHREDAYTTATQLPEQDMRENPLPRPSYGPQEAGPSWSTPEFVPTWQVASNQPMVNQAAIDHQVKHADPMRLDSDPIMVKTNPGGTGDEYLVRDGNHRVLAAQQRGQLLMPAHVRRRVE